MIGIFLAWFYNRARLLPNLFIAIGSVLLIIMSASCLRYIRVGLCVTVFYLIFYLVIVWAPFLIGKKRKREAAEKSAAIKEKDLPLGHLSTAEL